jgi:galactokinase
MRQGKGMRAAIVREFRRRFGGEPDVVARAPGRVNLIGEHTDYNQGLVLPCAVDRATAVAVKRRPDTTLRIFSRELAAEGRFDAREPVRRGDWLDYPAGVLRALWDEGVDCAGFDVAVASEIPLASGLSSSAALTLALVTAFDRCLALGLSARARCLLAHRAEADFVGVPCGIMDPFASGLSQRDSVLRIDCRSQVVERVPWPAARLQLLIVHSGVRRELAGGAFAQRRRECEEALAAARRAGIGPAGAAALRDLGTEHLPALESALAPLPFRRARHVIAENRRVEATCAALAAGDLAAVGAELCAGMRSLRDDFEVSTPELDALCELAAGAPGVYGSRLTGAGFGGCTLHLVDPAAAEAAGERIAAGFAERFGRRPPVWALRPADGARIVD